MGSATVLPPREYRREMERVRRAYCTPWDPAWGEEATNWERRACNILASMKLWERADYGALADFRQLIALRIAPWLAPNARGGEK